MFSNRCGSIWNLVALAALLWRGLLPGVLLDVEAALFDRSGRGNHVQGENGELRAAAIASSRREGNVES